MQLTAEKTKQPRHLAAWDSVTEDQLMALNPIFSMAGQGVWKPETLLRVLILKGNMLTFAWVKLQHPVKPCLAAISHPLPMVHLRPSRSVPYL